MGVIVTANTDTSAVIVREIADLALQLALEIKTGLKPPEVVHNRIKHAKSELPIFFCHFAAEILIFLTLVIGWLLFFRLEF